MKQNPFSIYDFLGYLIPGATVMYTVLIVHYYKGHVDFQVEELIAYLSIVGLENVIPFIILSYVLGHIISFCSSITIENYANWRYGYPSKYVIGIEHPGLWKSTKGWRDLVWRIVIVLGLLPVFIGDFLFGQLLEFKNHYRKPFDPLLKDLVKKKINALLILLDLCEEDEEDKDAKPHDFHRLVTHYAYETSNHHQARMSNYVALYGLLRTLSLIFNLLAWYVFLRVWMYFEFTWFDVLVIVVLGLLAYIFFMAFMKFYRRYTVEGLMVITVNEKLK